MTTPYQPPDLAGTDLSWEDREIATHGAPGDRVFVYPGRRVVRVPGRVWPSEPEECTAGLTETEWLAGGTLLVCLGCGLDST
jgi:hypothetical protein